MQPQFAERGAGLLEPGIGHVAVRGQRERNLKLRAGSLRGVTTR